MTIDFFIGVNLLSGIGQHTLKYSYAFPGSKFVEIQQVLSLTDTADKTAMIFALPVTYWFDIIPTLKAMFKKVILMTTCETETVHPDYGKLFLEFKDVAVSSTFCKDVFKKQFPNNNFNIVHAHVPLPISENKVGRLGLPNAKYIFYHIGNVLDPRKNVTEIVRAFKELNLPSAILVIKATCNSNISLQIPNVYILNGLVPQEYIDAIHDICHCYVSFSHSEGIGLGAVEAAMRNKPVILPEYGGAPDYIKSRFTIKCGRSKIEREDFLFLPGMEWGEPDPLQLREYMKYCYDNNILYADGEFTRNAVCADTIKDQFKTFY